MENSTKHKKGQQRDRTGTQYKTTASSETSDKESKGNGRGNEQKGQKGNKENTHENKMWKRSHKNKTVTVEVEREHNDRG